VGTGEGGTFASREYAREREREREREKREREGEKGKPRPMPRGHKGIEGQDRI